MGIFSYTVSTDLLNILFKYAREKGIDKAQLVQGCGVDFSEYQTDAARVPMPAFGRALSTVQNFSGDRDFGLHFGEFCCRMLNRHLFFAMMMNCRTVAQAIEKNFQYHNLIMDIISPEIICSGPYACVTWKLNHQAVEMERHFSESILAIQTVMLRILTEETIQLESVRFSHARPDRIDEHKRIFQAPMQFGCVRNEIHFSKSYLDKPVAFGNTTILAGLEQLVQEQLHLAYGVPSYTEKISRMLSTKIFAGKETDIETLSGGLAMSTRTLQLKLKKEGTSFRQIFDDVRKKIAISALKDIDTTICELSLMLQFSDQSAFHNAFKRWTGKTPSQYRKESP